MIEKQRKSRAKQYEEMLHKLNVKREKNVNRYIAPIEMKIREVKDKLNKIYNL